MELIYNKKPSCLSIFNIRNIVLYFLPMIELLSKSIEENRQKRQLKNV